MDYAACNVVYVDRSAKEDRLVKSDDPALAHLGLNDARNSSPVLAANGSLEANLHTLLGTFSEVYICSSGESCVAKLSELNRATIVDLIPTLVLIDMPHDDQFEPQWPTRQRTPSPNSRQEGPLEIDTRLEESPIYGLNLLEWLTSEMQYQSLSKLFVPIAVLAITQPVPASSPRLPSHSRSNSAALDLDPFAQVQRKSLGVSMSLDHVRTMRYLDAGASDVLTSPLQRERLPSLAIHAYRAHKDASKEQRQLMELKRGRKRSWVGVDDQKPYAYLREAMVSGLMDRICKLGGEDEPFEHARISITASRRQMIAAAVGTWEFSAHDFTDDELLHAASIMLQHALSMPELEKWWISAENITAFLVASRSAYNAFVPYHNFRHVVDVLQAVFHFLIRIGRLPSYPDPSVVTTEPLSPLAALVRPFEALTLLITAIGHDVGHPGVNNAFLVTLNAPLAQLYNDRSVLESFHCAAYSQILRRHWPAAFRGMEMRKLMIDSILATDMQLHFDYMKKLGYLQEKLHANGGTDGWNARILDEQRSLACSLLIKCADISNVARTYGVAEQWTMILTDEFARQASMEKDLGIPSALFAAPVREIIELGKSQIGFMNMFAIPLFQGVTDVMPAMGFTVRELQRNKEQWEMKIVAAEQARARQDSLAMDGMFSPRTMSLTALTGGLGPRRIGSVGGSNPNRPQFGRSSSDHQRIKEIFLSPNGDAAEPSPLLEESEESPREAVGASPGELLALSLQLRSSKPPPSHLHLSSATTCAPGCPDDPDHDHQFPGRNGCQVNGVGMLSSLLTDPVVIDPPTPHAETIVPEQQRTSDTTEGGSSAAGDWGSQATSATTGKMPLSPSTQGTSIMSHDSDNGTKSAASQTPTMATPSASNESQNSSSTAGRESAEAPLEGKDLSSEAVKRVKRKPSRFRINSLHFWKKTKSPSPPMPTDHGLLGASTRADESQA